MWLFFLDPDLFEGDMMLTNEQLQEINGEAPIHYAAFKTRPWPMPIYYEIDPGLGKCILCLFTFTG